MQNENFTFIFFDKKINKFYIYNKQQMTISISACTQIQKSQKSFSV